MLTARAMTPICCEERQAPSCRPRLRPLRLAIAAKGCMGGPPPFTMASPLP